MVRDLIPIISNLYFFGRFGNKLRLSQLQCAILLGMGLQSKTIDDLAKETTLPAGQLLAMFNKAIRKISKRLKVIFEEQAAKEVDATLNQARNNISTTKLLDQNNSTTKNISLDADLRNGAREGMHQQQRETEKMMEKSVPSEFMEYGKF